MDKLLVFALTLSLLHYCTTASSQDISNQPKNSLYFEVGGVGFAPISLNYERQFILGDKTSLSIGGGISFTKYIQVGGTIWINEVQLFVPIQLNLLLGKNRSKFEIGYGMPFAIQKEGFPLFPAVYVLRLGYRFQPYEHGLFFRASINPSIVVYLPTLMGSIGVGYSF